MIPTNKWTHLVMTYDGSSEAVGLHLYMNGEAMKTVMVRDHLFKDIQYRKEWGDLEIHNVPFALAGRFRDNGFKEGEISDVQLFDSALTEIEVGMIYNPAAIHTTDANQLKEYYFRRIDKEVQSLEAELKLYRMEDFKLVDDVPEIMVMEEMPGHRSTHILKRGAYDAPGDEVHPDVPARVFPFPANVPQDRLGLAQWLTDRGNPLVARVAVNRIWKMHFGRGIVATPDDFGSQGRLPSHPELLDYLAIWFVEHQWDFKALHRLIVDSETFKQTSIAARELVDRDPDNTLLARGPKIRLLAEQIRDQALASSGLLNRQTGGVSVFPYQPAGLWEQSGTGKTYTQDHGGKLYRRSLYTFWRRTAPPPSMMTFDAISREVCTAKREKTATPLQSLVLLNDTQFIEAARAMAQGLIKKNQGEERPLIVESFRRLTGRFPDDEELKILHRLLSEQKALFAAHPEDAEKILSIGESKRDKSLPAAEFAAVTSLVSTIMNHDEFVVER
jgi:hypothetical protein